MPNAINDLQVWFEKSFRSDCGYHLFHNIIQYVAAQGAPEEDTEDMIGSLLDNIGLSDEEKAFILQKIITET
jgi:hypothetical protein